MAMVDAGIKDHKIIAVATSDPEFSDYHEVSELPQHRVRMLRRFFVDFKQLEGKTVEVKGNPVSAGELQSHTGFEGSVQGHTDEAAGGVSQNSGTQVIVSSATRIEAAEKKLNGLYSVEKGDKLSAEKDPA